VVRKTAFNTRLALRRPFGRLRGSQNTSRAWAEALERPLWCFVHPHFCSPTKPVGFAHSGCKNIANLIRYVQVCLKQYKLFIRKNHKKRDIDIKIKERYSKKRLKREIFWQKAS